MIAEFPSRNQPPTRANLAPTLLTYSIEKGRYLLKKPRSIKVASVRSSSDSQTSVLGFLAAMLIITLGRHRTMAQNLDHDVEYLY